MLRARRELRDELGGRLPPELPLVERLHREAARAGPRLRMFPAGSAHRAQPSLRSRFASSIAACAASAPLLPSLPPARSSACSIVLGGEHAEGDRHAGLVRDARKAGGALAGDIVEVRGLAADHGAERDHGVVAAGCGDAPHHGRQVVGARHADQLEAGLQRAARDQRLHRAGDEALDDVFVEARRDERYAQVADPQVALDNANRVHAASISGAGALTPRNSVTSRPNAEMPCSWRGADSTRMRLTPRSRRICAPMP